MRFPQGGRSRAEIDGALAALAAMAAGDADWQGGRVPLFVFGAGPEVAEVGRSAFNAYFTENALDGRRAFPSLRRMEDEVVSMGLDLFNAPPPGRGRVHDQRRHGKRRHGDHGVP